MSDAKPSKFMPKEISPHATVSHLQHELDDISELYIIVRDKAGNYNEVICGDMGGLAFSVMALQKYWADHT